MEFETIIGLEVHVQLNTKTKIFCPCPTSFGAEPNTNVCPVCLGLPGTLPVLNKSAVIKAISLATAIKATVNRCSIFARKSYFYPDLPKSYQISQFESPIISDGSIEIECDGHTKTIRVARAHLEEDAGKSIHEGNISKIDFNRAGMPLIEIVSSPDIRSGKEAVSYLKKLHSIVRFLDISDANMQEGSFRCDANVSVRPVGDSNLYRRVEIKNLNSFRFIQKAIEYEVDRQTQAWEDGRYEDEVVQETRLFDTHKGMTKSMRGKEESADYRYFPDPDLPPLRIDDALMELGQRIPEMPDEKVKRYTEELGLKSSDAIVITRELDTTRFFEGLIEDGVNPKSAFTWLMVELLGRLKGENTISSCGIGHKMLSELIHKVNDGEISAKAAKDILDHIVERRGGDVDSIIAELGLAQVNDEKVIMDSIKEVLRVHKDKADEFRSGKEKILGFLVGQVMKHNKGMNPARVSAILKEELGRP